MYQVKYSPVIGWVNRTFVWSQSQSKSPGHESLPANHRAAFHLVHQTTEFHQTAVRQCKLHTVVETPPSHSGLMCIIWFGIITCEGGKGSIMKTCRRGAACFVLHGSVGR